MTRRGNASSAHSTLNRCKPKQIHLETKLWLDWEIVLNRGISRGIPLLLILILFVATWPQMNKLIFGSLQLMWGINCNFLFKSSSSFLAHPSRFSNNKIITLILALHNPKFHYPLPHIFLIWCCDKENRKPPKP